jgi:hypothetical protein
MMGNKEELSALKAKAAGTTIEIVLRVQDERYTLKYYLDNETEPKEFNPNKCYRKTKLSEFRKFLGDPEGGLVRKIWFENEDGKQLADAQTSLSDDFKILQYCGVDFDREKTTFGELGINKYSRIRVSAVESNELLA